MTPTTSAAGDRAARRAPTVLRCAAAVYAATAMFDFAAHPMTEGHRHFTSADYTFTALLFPFVLAALATVVVLHRLHDGSDGRLGRKAVVVTTVAVVAFAAAGVITLITNDTRSGPPLYPLAMVASLVGFAMLAVAFRRAGVLASWVGPVLLLGWIFGGPVAEGGTPGFRGAALIQAAICVAVAASVARTVGTKAVGHPHRAESTLTTSR